MAAQDVQFGFTLATEPTSVNYLSDRQRLMLCEILEDELGSEGKKTVTKTEFLVGGLEFRAWITVEKGTEPVQHGHYVLLMRPGGYRALIFSPQNNSC